MSVQFWCSAVAVLLLNQNVVQGDSTTKTWPVAAGYCSPSGPTATEGLHRGYSSGGIPPKLGDHSQSSDTSGSSPSVSDDGDGDGIEVKVGGTKLEAVVSAVSAASADDGCGVPGPIGRVKITLPSCERENGGFISFAAVERDVPFFCGDVKTELERVVELVAIADLMSLKQSYDIIHALQMRDDVPDALFLDYYDNLDVLKKAIGFRLLENGQYDEKYNPCGAFHRVIETIQLDDALGPQIAAVSDKPLFYRTVDMFLFCINEVVSAGIGAAPYRRKGKSEIGNFNTPYMQCIDKIEMDMQSIPQGSLCFLSFAIKESLENTEIMDMLQRDKIFPSFY